MVQLEEGKYYKTRDGRKVGPMRRGKYGGWYDRYKAVTSQSWFDNGAYINGISSQLDIVEHFPESPVIIALSGPAGSGKSTAAKYLVEHHGFVLVKFAAPLKNMLRAIGLSNDEIEGHLKQSSNPLLCDKTPRHAMQTLGTEWGRNCIGETFWTNLWEREADRYARVVCDDCRFENEAGVIRNRGGLIVGLTGRGGIEGSHVSEAGVTPDLTVNNSGDVKKLYETLDRLVRGM